MAEISAGRKSPEEIRAERMAAVKQPHVRVELDKMVNERDTKVRLFQEKQNERFESDVDAMIKQRALALRNPNYRGAAWPATREAVKQAVEINNRKARESEAAPYNERIDKRLDRYERSIQLQQQMNIKRTEREVTGRKGPGLEIG